MLPLLLLFSLFMMGFAVATGCLPSNKWLIYEMSSFGGDKFMGNLVLRVCFCCLNKMF
jgi:hypothetical protein